MPAAYWVLAGTYVLACAWLALVTRVFMDQVWITDYGRRLLDPDAPYSMFMLPDGTSLPASAWFGPLIAELSLRTSGSLFAFRAIAVASAVLMSWSVIRLAQRNGVSAGLATLIGGAFLFDASNTQSVILGRADTLALAILFSGMLLAKWSADRLATRPRAWLWLAAGYSLCAFAPAIWSTTLLLGPLVLAQWASLATTLYLGNSRRISASMWLALVLVPGVVFLLAVALPFAYWWRVESSADLQWTVQASAAAAYAPLFIVQQLSVSLCLVLAGVLGLFQLRPRWLAITLAIGATGILFSGFYPFRVPYLLTYLIAAIVLRCVQLTDDVQLRAWRKLCALCLAVGIALMGVRVVLALENERRPNAPPWFAELPGGTGIADFSWDFYEAARREQRPIMRSFPGIDADLVVAWLRRSRPDFVVRAIDATGSWELADDLNAALTQADYCARPWIDWTGKTIDPAMRIRPAPTPLLWRLGMFRSHGPYALWAPCTTPASKESPQRVKP